jgi:hypothetical protein
VFFLLCALAVLVTVYDEVVETLVSEEFDLVDRERKVHTTDRLKDDGFFTLTDRGCFGSNATFSKPSC